MKKLLLILLLSITHVHAQTNNLTIGEGLIIGLNSSYEIKIANSDTLISDAQVTNAWSNMLPIVTVGANYNHLSEMPIQFNLPFPQSTNSDALTAIYANAEIEQPLFTGFRLLSLKNASEYNKEASLLEKSKVKNNKALEIHQAFWSYYKAEKFIEVLIENLSVVESQLNNVENLLKTGLTTKSNLLKLRVAVGDVKSKLIDATHNSKIAQANFNRVIGFAINAETKISAPNYIEEVSNRDFNAILSEALNSRLELKANNFRIKAADEIITAAKSTWFPQVKAFGSYNYLKLEGGSLLNEDAVNFWMVGLGMKWNIWDWWKTSSNTTIAEEQHFQIEVASKMLREKIEIEVYSNFLNLESEADKIKLNKLRVESAEENFRIIDDKFTAQVATSTELMEASTLLTEAKIKLINSYINYKLARIKLDNSIGRKIY
ncbi:MAG: TolC family protein [Melioribacteraceae bacterium]|nr:TolC family protein [Melioribacteraceae bacterium]